MICDFFILPFVLVFRIKKKLSTTGSTCTVLVRSNHLVVGLRNDVRWRGITQLECEMENVGGGQEASLRIQYLSTNIAQYPFNSQ
jgi:hypothetical protein